MEKIECAFCDDTGYTEFQSEPDNTETRRCPYCNPKNEELLEHNLE